MTRFREVGAVLLAGLVLGLVITGPVWLDPANRVLGGADSETLSGPWLLRFGATEILAGRLPILAADLNWPHGRGLHVVPLLDAILTIPLVPLVQAPTAYNLVLLAEIVFAFGAAWLFFRPLAARRWLVLPAATAFATAPVLLSIVGTGPTEGVSLGWFPLDLWLIQRLVTAPRARTRDVVATGLAMGATFLANPYYFAFIAVAGLFFYLPDGLAAFRAAGPGRLRSFGGRLLAASGIAAAVIAPQVYAIQASLELAGPLGPRFRDPGITELLIHRVFVIDVGTLLLPTNRWSHITAPVHLYLGLVLVLGALAGLGRPGWRRWAALALAAGVYSLGAWLEVFGWRARVGGYELSMPALFLHEHVPPFQWVSHAFRALPLAILGLGALLVLGLARLPARLQVPGALAATALVLADNLALAPGPFPLQVQDLHVPDFYRRLGDDPDRYAVLDILDGEQPLNFHRALMYNAWHHKGLLFDLEPPDKPLIDNPVARLVHADPADPDLLAPANLCSGASRLAAAGVRYVVHHDWNDAPDPRAELLRICNLEIVHVDEQVEVFRLPGDAPGTDPR